MLARRLNDLARKFNAEGFDFGWHNHEFELEALPDGSIPLDIILAEAPDILWEGDFAWVVRGGGDPVEHVKRYGRRLAAVHVKDIAPVGSNQDEDGWADLGDGTIDWPTLVQTIRREAPGVSYILEHDNPSDPIRFATRSAKAFAEIWKTTND